jgi:branched-chain amino acid transport system permease protein
MAFVGAVFVLFIALSASAALAPAAWVMWANAVGLLALANAGTVPYTRAIGQPPYSQIFFFGLSAVASAWLATEREWLPAAALLLVLIVGGGLAWGIGFLFKRMQKWQVNLVTAALGATAFLLVFLMSNARSPIARNVPVMESFGITFMSQGVFLAMIWILLIVLVWTVSNVFESFIGRNLVVSLEDEPLADEYGIDSVSAAGNFFLLASVPAIFAGWVFAFWIRSVGAEVVSAPLWLACIVVCLAAAWLGPWGAVVGSAAVMLPLSLVPAPAFYLRWDANALAFGGLLVCAALMWKYAKVLSKLFQNLRRRIDPHEVDLGMVDERSGMKAHGVPPPGTEVLRLDHIAMGESTRPAVQDVSFDIHVGETIAVFSDRSDTRRALLALLSGRVVPRQGDILVWGQSGKDIATQNWGRHGIARTHQPPRLIEDFHVIDNVAVGASSRLPMSLLAAMVRANMGNERVVRSEAMYHLSRVWMREEAQTKVKELSPSRQQLVELARALTADPALLVLDNMGKTIRQPELGILLDFIKDLNSTGVAVIVLDEDWEFARAIAQRLIVIESGLVTADGATERVLSQTGMRDKLARFAREASSNTI